MKRLFTIRQLEHGNKESWAVIKRKGGEVIAEGYTRAEASEHRWVEERKHETPKRSRFRG